MRPTVDRAKNSRRPSAVSATLGLVAGADAAVAVGDPVLVEPPHQRPAALPRPALVPRSAHRGDVDLRIVVVAGDLQREPLPRAPGTDLAVLQARVVVVAVALAARQHQRAVAGLDERVVVRRAQQIDGGTLPPRTAVVLRHHQPETLLPVAVHEHERSCLQPDARQPLQPARVRQLQRQRLSPRGAAVGGAQEPAAGYQPQRAIVQRQQRARLTDRDTGHLGNALRHRFAKLRPPWRMRLGS